MQSISEQLVFTLILVVKKSPAFEKLEKKEKNSHIKKTTNIKIMYIIFQILCN
jgi:hypothetical protein